MPLELIGAADFTVKAELEIAGAQEASQLYLQAHRLAFEDASTNPDRGAKGSMRLNDGPWLPLTNDVATCRANEAKFGCLSGAYHTVRFTVPLDRLGEPGLREGSNNIEFRFNGTDGQSSGYRILALNFLDDSGKELISKPAFTEDNPDLWKAPRPAQADIDRGRELFATHRLKLSPLAPNQEIEAACSDCHAEDGRDLTYFNYSNLSIIERCKFHGMRQEQGEQVTSYIRSIDLELPEGTTLKDLGRPWAPPYQPGPGLDEKPAIAWSAGAGLGAVAESDMDTLTALGGASVVELAKHFSPNKNINHQEMPVAIQFPDWNEWLPEVHPLEVWGREFESETYKIGYASPWGGYRESVRRFGRGELQEGIRALNDFMESTHSHAGGRVVDVLDFAQRDGGRLTMKAEGNDIVVYDRSGTAHRTDKEIANRALRHWASVKQWELMQVYQLAERGAKEQGPLAEERSWLVEARNVFELAPHRAAHNNESFVFQTKLVGKYFSNAWYQLQMTLGAGLGTSRAVLRPVDWNYQSAHIADFVTKVEGPVRPMRLAATVAEMLQRFSHSRPRERDWAIRQMHPMRYAPGSGQWRVLEALPQPQRGIVLDAMLAATLDLLEPHPASEWQRHRAGPER